MLGIHGLAVVGGDLDFFIGDTVAVFIAGKPQIGRRGDQDAAVHERKRARHHEAVKKHGALVHTTVAVGVFEHGNGTDGRVLAFAVDVGHVAAHLDDPETAVGGKRECDRIVHQGLSGDEFNAETWGNLERF